MGHMTSLEILTGLPLDCILNLLDVKGLLTDYLAWFLVFFARSTLPS